MLGILASRLALHIAAKKRSAGGPFATRVPYNPETSVGLKAALAEPLSAHLHLAERICRSARSITLRAMTTDICGNCGCCNTPYCKMTNSCVEDFSLLCKLCDRCMDGRIIYMYMSMGFCTEECMNEYFLEYRYRLAMGMETDGRRTRIEARTAPVAEGEEAIGYRRIFFICAEVED